MESRRALTAAGDGSDPDLHLLTRMKTGDEGAMREAIQVFGASIFSTAWRLVRNAALAEEVAQEVLISLWRNPDAFDPARGNLRTLLVQIARNKAIDVVRHEDALRNRNRREALKDLATLGPTAQAGRVEGPSNIVEQRDEVISALSSVSSLQREMIVLVYFGGRTSREAAEELGIPHPTAKTRLRDGLLKLRDRMAGGS